MTNSEPKRREKQLNRWVKERLVARGERLEPEFQIFEVSDDASFRRYFRGSTRSNSFIYVDAPPEQEDNQAFVRVARLLNKYGLNAPLVHEVDFQQGYMMLSDLGNELYLDVVRDGDHDLVARLYDAALDVLEKFGQVDTTGLPSYTESVLRREMNLFADWFLAKQMDVHLDHGELSNLEAIFQLMVSNATQQPQVFVHRDFHSRNLMITPKNCPGIIDFQDAIKGPVTYDLVSLLKDCYWKFSRDEVVTTVQGYWKRLDLDVEVEQFLRWFDLMGMQRHLKCAGIFSRLNLRDGKPGYLNDIPLVLDYILEVCEEYDEIRPFGGWLRDRILPALTSKLKL